MYGLAEPFTVRYFPERPIKTEIITVTVLFTFYMAVIEYVKKQLQTSYDE